MYRVTQILHFYCEYLDLKKLENSKNFQILMEYMQIQYILN